MGKKKRRPGSKTRKSKFSFGIADWRWKPKSWREGGRWTDGKRRAT